MSIKKLAIFTSVLLAFLLFAPIKVFSATDHVVINEVQITGGSGNSNNDFIELYNPTDSDYDLTDHRLVKRTADGTTDSSIKTFENDTIIPAHGYYLWSNSGWDPGVAPDSSTSATLANNNGVALRNGAANTGEIVDSVAWGTVTNAFVEGSPYPDNPEANTSIQRTSGEDSNNNSVDFTLNNSPSPQNSSSSESPSPSPSPTTTESPAPTPTQSPSTSPTESPTPEPTTTPEPTISPTPTATPQPTVTPNPTSNPKMIYLSSFGFGQHRKICYLRYDYLSFGFVRVSFPRIVCVK